MLIKTTSYKKFLRLRGFISAILDVPLGIAAAVAAPAAA